MPWRRLRPAAPVAIFLLLLGALRIWVGWQAIAAVFVVLSGASLVLAALMLVGIRPKGRPGHLAPLLALLGAVGAAVLAFASDPPMPADVQRDLVDLAVSISFGIALVVLLAAARSDGQRH